MIFVSNVESVNGPGLVHLSREQLWAGLVMKANNALPFVPAMQSCEVVERHSDVSFDRNIVLRGQPHTERIVLEEPYRVVFTRVAGPVLGVITNEILGSDDDLQLRFSFALAVGDTLPDSKEEADYAASMTDDYLKACAATLASIRASAEAQAAQK